METLNYEREEFNFLNVDMFCDKDGNSVYKMINHEKPGQRYIMIKPFLTSLARQYIANAMYKFDPTLKNTIRVCCDDLVLRKKIEKIPNTKNYKLLIPEPKTTGWMWFKSRFTYYNHDQKYFAGQWSENDTRKAQSKFS